MPTTIFDQPLDPTFLDRMAARHEQAAAVLRTQAEHATEAERDKLLAKAERHEQAAVRDRERAA